MRSIPEIVPVTMVHEVMTPSDDVKRLIEKLIASPDKMQQMTLRTTAQRIIDRSGSYVHPRFQYAEEFRRAEMLLGAVGKSALMLSGQAQLRTNKRGDERLFLSARSQDQLDTFVHAMDGIPSVEAEDSTRINLLYMQFSKDSLTKDVLLRRDILDELGARGRHPATKPYMKALSPRIVMRDIDRYPLRRRLPEALSDDEQV